MPIMLPLADLAGVPRHVSVTAYCFGDGFSNPAYSTNPITLIVWTYGGQLPQVDVLDHEIVVLGHIGFLDLLMDWGLDRLWPVNSWDPLCQTNKNELC